MSTNVVNVARSVAEHETANAVDRATVIIDRVEIYFHNDTYAADRDNPAYDKWRGLFPYDTDEVSLVAVVWAKAEGDDAYKPYSGEGFKNDGLYFCPCEKRPSPASNKVPWDWREKNLEDRLSDEIEKVEAWPWTGIDMQFEWQQLFFEGSGGNAGRTYVYKKPKLVRLTSFPEGMEDSEGAIATEELYHDWDIPLTPGEFGTRRFRVVLGLEGQVEFGKRFSRMEADHLTTLKLCDEFETKITSKRETGKNGYAQRGMSLRLSIRRAEVPKGRTDGMTETLRWGTAFINTAYDNGGHWFGGRVGDEVNQSGASVYGGHGIDCNGFICGAAMLAGVPGYAPISWEDYKAQHADSKKSEEDLKKAWTGARRRYRYAPMKRDLRWYKGAKVPASDLTPGDMLDYQDHSHVALIYDVDHATGDIWIMDSSGSIQGVSIHKLNWSVRNVEKHGQLVDLTDPQPRPWKE